MAQRPWKDEDLLLVLASYLEAGGVPPEAERQRIANLTRHPVEAVSRAAAWFAALDPEHLALGEVTAQAERLWSKYERNRPQAMLDADEVRLSKRRIPKAFRRK